MIGMETPTPDREILSYSAPDAPLPNPLIASLLAAPGLFCWVSLALLLAGRWTGWHPPVDVMLILWGIAVLAAIASILIYRRARKPWYVLLCLAVNVSGLLFTLAVLTLPLWGEILF